MSTKKKPRLLRVVKLDPIVKTGAGKSYGRAFDAMIAFMRVHRMLAIELIGETHTFPGRTEKLIVEIPKEQLAPPIVRTSISKSGAPFIDRRRGGRRR